MLKWCILILCVLGKDVQNKKNDNVIEKRGGIASVVEKEELFGGYKLTQFLEEGVREGVKWRLFRARLHGSAESKSHDNGFVYIIDKPSTLFHCKYLVNQVNELKRTMEFGQMRTNYCAELAENLENTQKKFYYTVLQFYTFEPRFIPVFRPTEELSVTVHGDENSDNDVINKYEIEKFLGRGTYGEAYMAISKGGGKKVVLKILSANPKTPLNSSRKDELKGNYIPKKIEPLRENSQKLEIDACLAAQEIQEKIQSKKGKGRFVNCLLNNGWIVKNEVSLKLTVWEYGGESLDIFMPRNLHDIQVIVKSVLQGIYFLKTEAKIAHRDIKIANIVWNPETMVVKLIDYSLMKRVQPTLDESRCLNLYRVKVFEKNITSYITEVYAVSKRLALAPSMPLIQSPSDQDSSDSDSEASKIPNYIMTQGFEKEMVNSREYSQYTQTFCENTMNRDKIYNEIKSALFDAECYISYSPVVQIFIKMGGIQGQYKAECDNNQTYIVTQENGFKFKFFKYLGKEKINLSQGIITSNSGKEVIYEEMSDISIQIRRPASMSNKNNAKAVNKCVNTFDNWFGDWVHERAVGKIMNAGTNTYELKSYLSAVMEISRQNQIDHKYSNCIFWSTNFAPAENRNYMYHYDFEHSDLFDINSLGQTFRQLLEKVDIEEDDVYERYMDLITQMTDDDKTKRATIEQTSKFFDNVPVYYVGEDDKIYSDVLWKHVIGDSAPQTVELVSAEQSPSSTVETVPGKNALKVASKKPSEEPETPVSTGEASVSSQAYIFEGVDLQRRSFEL